MKPKILVIVGPTASGKSSLAVKIAKKFDGEIISADSRQVYEGLDIGTGKITKKEMGRIKHHLLDVENPKKKYDVSRYQKDSSEIINGIVKKSKLPIICGGTGFYMESLVYKVTFPKVPPNMALRKRLEKKSASALFKILKKRDARRALGIDSKNKVRLIRALEIISKLGSVPRVSKTYPYNSLIIGVKLEDRILRNRIRSRLIKRMRNGMIKEAKQLHKNGLTWGRMNELGLEYKFLALYLQGQISKKEMVKQLEIAIWQYSRRQMTWFRKNKDILWFDVSKKTTEKSMGKIIEKFLI